MQCPSCDNQKMVLETRDVPYSYRGQSTMIKNVTAEYCPSCDEMVLEHEEAQRLSDAMSAFNKQVIAATVDPGYIRDVRKKLRLDQKEAAEIFGGGVNAFSRYELGKAMPPVSLVKLLRVLDAHPELLPLVQ